MSGSRDGDGLIPSPSPKVEDLSTFRKYIDPTLSSLSLVFFLEFDSSIGEKEEEEYKFRLEKEKRGEGRKVREGIESASVKKMVISRFHEHGFLPAANLIRDG